MHHRTADESYWCLPGGGIEAGESPEAAALRELVEECRLQGRILAPAAVTTYAPGDHHFTFRSAVDRREATLGRDPEFALGSQILADVAWKSLQDVQPLDRVYLWTAGLLAVPGMLENAGRLRD